MRKENVNVNGNKAVSMEVAALKYAKLENHALLTELNTTEHGLKSAEAEQLLEYFGKNEIDYGKTQPWFVRLLLSFANPFSLVLLIVAAVSFITEVLVASDQSWATVIIILALVGISGIMQFVQE